MIHTYIYIYIYISRKCGDNHQNFFILKALQSLFAFLWSELVKRLKFKLLSKLKMVGNAVSLNLSQLFMHS